MLAIEIEFLLGRYVAADFRDREVAEWPPHPERLFSALVAAAYESELGESAHDALLWLEALPPPHVAADQNPSSQTPVTVFVPVNDPPDDDLLPQRVARQPRAFPSVVPGGTEGRSCVHVVWPDARPDDQLKRLLSEIAAAVTYLGSSRSPVAVRLTDSPPEPNWIPDEQGKDVLRVPYRGRLESLGWHYQNRLRPPAGSFCRYRCGARQPDGPGVAECVHGEMLVYRLAGSAWMEIETTLKLTDSLRASAMRRAQEALGGVPEVLSGHDPEGKPSARPHAAYLALPFVSETQPHADGRILGLAVALPRWLPTQERRRIARSLAPLDHLSVPGVGRLGLEPVTPDLAAPHNLRPETWEGPARRWASVTPVVFDRFPKRNKGASAVLARSCEAVGLPAPLEAVPDRCSPLHGVEPSSRFCVRRGHGDKARPSLFSHVTLTFAQEVRGPLLLGASRHFGLGLFRPLREGNDAPG